LEKHKLAEKILATVNELLTQRGLLLKAGTAVDANRWFMIECWHWESKQSTVKFWSLIVVIAIAALRFW